MRKNLSSTLFRTALTVAMSAALAVTLPAELFGEVGGGVLAALDEWSCADCNGTEHDHEVIVGTNQKISGGTFKQKVTVMNGRISDGIFEGDVEVSGDGTIFGGTFKGNVTVGDGTITSGTFEGDVTVNGGKIEGGTFTGKVTVTTGTISDGNFYGTVDNSGTISGGHYVSSDRITGNGSVDNTKVTYGLGSSSGGTGSETGGETGGTTGSTTKGSSKDSSHTHSYSWETVQEATIWQDGIEEYRCSCGDVQERSVIPASTSIADGFCNAVGNAPQNGIAEYDSGWWYTMSDYFIRELAKRPDVTTVVTFKYQNQYYKMTIPAGIDYTQLLTDEEYFYGYFYFAGLTGARIEVVE